MRRRVWVHSLMILVAWPLLSAVLAGVEARSIPYHTPTWMGAIVGGLAGALILGADFFVIGALSIIISVVLFTRLGPEESQVSRGRLVLEPLLLFAALLFGTSLNYPAALNHPILFFVRPLPVWLATMLLAVGVGCTSLLLGSRARRIKLSLAVMIIGVAASLPSSWSVLWSSPGSGTAPLVLLGLDSLSHSNDLEYLKKWSDSNQGTWYRRAVPPGLLTNSVWASLLAMRPVREHGIFHTFQSFHSLAEEETLVKKARRAGYFTVSVFPDQLTCWVGTQAGFDEDRSGPVGWRQLATSYVENASLLLPLFRPVLPKVPFSAIPRNHAGTFTYDLDRELYEMFSMSSVTSQIFVAAHLTFLHSPRYPRYAELSWAERKRILHAEVNSIRDRSFDWQDIQLPGDPIPLDHWKIQRLIVAVTRAIGDTGFLNRGGRLVLFSDHGNRSGMTLDTFPEERYHHVPLVTFGLPGRSPDTPISLLDVPSLLGIMSPGSTFEPIVEFTLAPSSEWPSLVRGARVGFDGLVELNKAQLASVFRTLRAYRPWSDEQSRKIIEVFDGNDASGIPTHVR